MRRVLAVAARITSSLAAVALPLALAAQSDIGKAVFDRNCAACHGSDATGSLGPALVPLAFSDADLLAVVRAGGSQMRPLTPRDLPDDAVRAIAVYLRTLSPASQARPQAGPTATPRAVAPSVEHFTAPAAHRLSPVTDDMLASPDPSSWLNWRRTLDGWGFSPLTHITTANVRTLQLAWSWALEPGASQTTPIVHDGVMFVASPGNIVHALDAATGQLLWEYRRAAAQTRSLAIYGEAVILATVDAHLVALDTGTGAVRWDTNVGGSGTAGFTFTSGPIIAAGTIIGGLTGCSRFDDETCYIVGVDGRDGRLLWRTSTLALPGQPGGDTWSDLPITFRAGGDAWMPGSYDPQTKTILWGTAQAKPWAQAVRGSDGDALYTNSTLALDPASGQIKWYFQHLPGESFDMDEAFERILVDRDGHRSVFTMGKLGILWELDRTNGKFVNATDLGYQTLVDVNPRSGRATYKPGMLQRTGQAITFCPSTGGLKSLRAMAYHPAQRAFYVPLNLNCETSTFDTMERREGGGGVGPVRRGQYTFHPKSPNEMGELQALDVSGRMLWKQRRRAPFTTATLTTGGGLVFVGSYDRGAFAYDAQTGAPLWHAGLPTMANGFPITYAVNGRQFVAFGAGATLSGTSWASRVPSALLPDIKNPSSGNGIYVFALPEGR
jgi:alcohol dehydrogenase (cytochrome c)